MKRQIDQVREIAVIIIVINLAIDPHAFWLIFPSGNFEDVPPHSSTSISPTSLPDTFTNEENQDDVSSTTSDDFIVVSKVFDLSTPLDEDEIRKRLKYEFVNHMGDLSDVVGPSAFSMHVNEQMNRTEDEDDDDNDSASIEVVQIGSDRYRACDKMDFVKTK